MSCISDFLIKTHQSNIDLQTHKYSMSAEGNMRIASCADSDDPNNQTAFYNENKEH